MRERSERLVDMPIGHRARNERGRPMTSLNVRAFAALVLLALFPVFVVLVVAAIIAAGVWVTKESTGRAGAHVLVLAIPLVIAVAAACRDVFRARKPEPLPGHELRPSDHPQLFAELRTISRAMRQPMPDRVVVAPVVNAMVTTGTGKREVLIGYPLLAGMNRLQLRAVLAHEMGHLAHGHTRTGALAYRAGGVLEQTVARMDPGIVRRVMSGYHHLYLLISMSVMRDHERQADEWSARLAGGPEAATIFPELARISAIWELLCDSYLPLATQVKARPGLAMALQQLRAAHEERLDGFAAKKLAERPSRWSTHPGDAERMRFLEQSPAAPAADRNPADLYPAWQLLGQRPASLPAGTPDWDGAGRALLEIERGLLPSGAEAATWEQVVHEFQLSSARSQTAMALDQLAEQAPEAAPTLRGLLMSMSERPGAALVEPMLRGDLPPGQRAEIAQQVLEETAQLATQLAVMNAGRARWVLRWEGPAELEYTAADGSVQEWPDDLTIVSPIDAYSVNPLLTRLFHAGIDIDAPLVSDLDRESQQRTLNSIVTGGVCAVQLRPPPPGTQRLSLHDLLVMDDGLLVSFAPSLTASRRALMAMQAQYLQSSLRRDGLRRIQALADGVAGDPKAFAADPAHRAQWLAYSDVTTARLKGDKGGLGEVDALQPGDRRRRGDDPAGPRPVISAAHRRGMEPI